MAVSHDIPYLAGKAGVETVDYFRIGIHEVCFIIL